MYILKNLCSEHVQALVALEKKCFSKPWGEKECLAVFSQKHFSALGLWIEAEKHLLLEHSDPQKIHDQYLVAYISFYHIIDEMEILNIAVDPAFQNQGLGTYIFGKALESARLMNMQKIVLEVREGNMVARHLYEKFSFVTVGIRKKYYTDNGEDACIYTLDL